MASRNVSLLDPHIQTSLLIWCSSMLSQGTDAQHRDLRAKRKTAVAILVPQFSYFNFHMNFSCKLSVYIYIYIYVFSVWKLKINSILFYSHQINSSLPRLVDLGNQSTISCILSDSDFIIVKLRCIKAGHKGRAQRPGTKFGHKGRAQRSGTKVGHKGGIFSCFESISFNWRYCAIWFIGPLQCYNMGHNDHGIWFIGPLQCYNMGHNDNGIWMNEWIFISTLLQYITIHRTNTLYMKQHKDTK